MVAGVGQGLVTSSGLYILKQFRRTVFCDMDFMDGGFTVNLHIFRKDLGFIYVLKNKTNHPISSDIEQQPPFGDRK